MDSSTDVNSAAATLDATPAPAAETTQAESSPAAATEQEHSKFEVPRDPKAYAEWRQKGTLPGPKSSKPKTEDSAPSTDEGSAPDDGGEKTAPASESGSKQKQEQQPLTAQRRSAEHRLQDLLADIKRAGFTPAELKTFKREVQQQTQAQPSQAGAPEKTVQPPAKPTEPPRLEDFATWDEYRKAEREYNDAIVTQRVQAELQQHLAKQQAETRMAEAKARYGDEAESYIVSTATKIFNDAQIPPVIKAVLNESAVCADVLYVMGSNAQELADFLELSRSNPGQALRKVVLLEQLVQDELRKGAKPAAAVVANGMASETGGSERDESGRFVKQPAAPASRKTAPAPATEVSGRASAPPDRLEQAFRNNDFRAFRDEANRRDMNARRGK